jgi:periplasmic protein TonB
METLAPQKFASPETEPEFHLLLVRDRRAEWRRWRSAAILSVLVHVVVLTGLLLIPDSEDRVYEERQPVLHLTPLYVPTELTQKDPNKGKLSKELTIAAIPERPVVKVPAPAPPVKQAPLPAPQVAKAEPKPVFVEPPKIEPPKTQVDSQTDQLAKLGTPLPPPAQQPKIVMENVAAPPPPPARAGANPGKLLGNVGVPNTSVDAAVHAVTANNGLASGRQSVADTGTDLGNSGLNLPPSAGSPHSNLELKSDAMGVDFRPYMMQVLAAVRRNWFAVYPEAARLGQRGEVVLEFAIAKQGLVTKVIFSTESGAKALDQSAVAAISASNPLPPLPAEFKGDRIVLRMTFMYNIKR